MRIGLIVTGGVDRSGRERVTPALLWLIERLARRHELHVFALHYYDRPCNYSLLGATVYDIGRIDGPPGLRRWRVRRRLAQTLARVGTFDVLHAYMGVPAIVTAPIAARLRVPFIASLDSGEFVAIDDIDYGLQRRWIDRRALTQMIGTAGAVTVSTRFMAEQAARAGITATIVPIGIDTNVFPLVKRDDGPPWRLLRVGSLNRVKDYPTLLAAVRSILDRGEPVHLDVVGEDTLNGATEALATSLDLAPHVTFHGVKPIDQLAAFYARAHVHVVSSRHEAASVAVLEAAATGLPTVGTRVGYVADWSPDRAAAVPVGDSNALSEAIIALLQDPARRQQLAQQARAWTLAHDADWTAAQYDALYRRVATR
ncbi:MAG TPA: glycosyltransferase family 4 protein [Vicinamibacterales bacterium]|nr:glycosyltransferase family 4 protein [Vicinamibacterales bacterium]